MESHFTKHKQLDKEIREKKAQLDLEAKENGYSPKLVEISGELLQLAVKSSAEVDILKDELENSKEFKGIQKYRRALHEKEAGTRADEYARRFREAINLTNECCWHTLFNDPLFGGLNNLTKDYLKQVEGIAIRLGGEADGGDDCLLGALYYDMINRAPDVREIPTLLGTIKEIWDRAGIPEDTRTLDDLLDYFKVNVFPRFVGDQEAVAIAENIGRVICWKILYYIEEIVTLLRNRANIKIVYIQTPFSTRQLRKVYNELQKRGYIEADRWPEFISCLNPLTPVEGRIYWKKKQPKAKQAHKAAIVDLLRLLMGEFDYKKIKQYAGLFRCYRLKDEAHPEEGGEWEIITIADPYKSFSPRTPDKGSESWPELKAIIEEATR